MTRDVMLWEKYWGKRPHREDVHRAVESIPLNPYAEEMVRELKNHNIIVGVLSAGVGQAAKHVANLLGLDFYIANNIVFDKNGQVSRHQKARVPPFQKPLLLTWITRKLGVSLKETVYVGDSSWDIGVIHMAGCGVAYNPDPKLAREANIVVESLAEIPRELVKC